MLNAESMRTFLVGLTIPLAAIAIVLGLVSLVRVIKLLRRGQPVRHSGVAQRIALFALSASGIPGAVIMTRALIDGAFVIAAIGAAQFALSLGGIAAYFTAQRPATEAFAAIALGVFAIVTGFSIGALIAPFAVAMGVLANMHSRLERRHDVLRS